MRRAVIITARRRTPEETGRLYGLSKRRTKQIIDMVEKSLAKRGYAHLYYGRSSANRNGERTLATYPAERKADGGQAQKKTKSGAAPRTTRKRAKAKPAH